MKLIKIILLFSIFSLISCEAEEPSITENATRIANSNLSKSNFTGKIKNVRIRKRRVGSGFKVVGRASFSGGIDHYAVSIQEREGVFSFPSSFDIEPKGELDENGESAFNFNALEFEGENPEGQPFLIVFTPMDAENNPKGEAEQFWITVQGNDGIDMKNVTIKETNAIGVFRYKVKITGENASQIDKVTMSVAGLDNDLVYPEDGQTISLENNETDNNGISIWATIDVTYQNPNEQTALLIRPENTVGVTITASSETGELLDREVHNISVIAKPQEDGIVAQPVTISLNNNGNGFKIRTAVKGTDKDKVDHVNIIFEEPFEGPAPLETEVSAFKVRGNVTTNIYRSETISFDNNEDAIGQEYLVLLDYVDAEGNPVSFQTEQYVRVEGNAPEPENCVINDIAFRNLGENTYTTRVLVEGLAADSPPDASFTLESLEDGSTTTPNELILYLTETEDGTLAYESQDFGFENPDVADGQEYLGRLKYNIGDDELDCVLTVSNTNFY